MSAILIVDEDSPFRRSLIGLLRGRFAHIRIEVVETFPAAAQAAVDTRFRVAIINLHIANGQGLALTIRLKRNHPQIQVLLLADYDLPEYRQAASQSGADGFMSKDRCDGSKIIRLVKAALV